jgi:hypothetical protein
MRSKRDRKDSESQMPATHNRRQDGFFCPFFVRSRRYRNVAIGLDQLGMPNQKCSEGLRDSGCSA